MAHTEQRLLQKLAAKHHLLLQPKEKCPEVVDGGVEVHPKGNIGLSGFGLGDQFDAIDKLHARDHAGQ